jgi:hypothetical protein
MQIDTDFFVSYHYNTILFTKQFHKHIHINMTLVDNDVLISNIIHYFNEHGEMYHYLEMLMGEVYDSIAYDVFNRCDSSTRCVYTQQVAILMFLGMSFFNINLFVNEDHHESFLSDIRKNDYNVYSIMVGTSLNRHVIMIYVYGTKVDIIQSFIGQYDLSTNSNIVYDRTEFIKAIESLTKPTSIDDIYYAYKYLFRCDYIYEGVPKITSFNYKKYNIGSKFMNHHIKNILAQIPSSINTGIYIERRIFDYNIKIIYWIWIRILDSSSKLKMTVRVPEYSLNALLCNTITEIYELVVDISYVSRAYITELRSHIHYVQAYSIENEKHRVNDQYIMYQSLRELIDYMLLYCTLYKPFFKYSKYLAKIFEKITRTSTYKHKLFDIDEFTKSTGTLYDMVKTSGDLRALITPFTEFNNSIVVNINNIIDGLKQDFETSQLFSDFKLTNEIPQKSPPVDTTDDVPHTSTPPTVPQQATVQDALLQTGLPKTGTRHDSVRVKYIKYKTKYRALQQNININALHSNY